MASLPRRIVLTGSESTGKSTLARGLADHFQVPLIPEFSRSYAEGLNRPLTAADVEPIARGQALAEKLGLLDQALAVFDTDLVSTYVYARHYYGAVPKWIASAIRRYPPSAYLLCDIDLPWVSDGIRDQPHDRAAIHRQFQAALGSFGIEPLPIQGTGPSRLEHAIAALTRWPNRQR